MHSAVIKRSYQIEGGYEKGGRKGTWESLEGGKRTGKWCNSSNKINNKYKKPTKPNKYQKSELWKNVFNIETWGIYF